MLHWNWFLWCNLFLFFSWISNSATKKELKESEIGLLMVIWCVCWFCILFGVDKTYIKKVSPSRNNSPFIRASIPFQIIWTSFTVKWESNRAKMRFQITYNYVCVFFSSFLPKVSFLLEIPFVMELTIDPCWQFWA